MFVGGGVRVDVYKELMEVIVKMKKKSRGGGGGVQSGGGGRVQGACVQRIN